MSGTIRGSLFERQGRRNINVSLYSFLDELGSSGIAAVAIDIPHFGRSKSLSTVSDPVGRS